jgi:catechol 2,3-dioxygenase-like lactoylglutathione lyase family enzyme
MIAGAHVILFAEDAARARAFLGDALGLDSVDAGGGWRIFALPPAELAALGATAVGLGVAGHNERARGLYESVGMRPRYVVLRYEKRL